VRTKIVPSARRGRWLGLAAALLGVVVLDLVLATVPESDAARAAFQRWAYPMLVLAALVVVAASRWGRVRASTHERPDESQLLRLHAESLAAAFAPAMVHDGNNSLLALRFQLAELERLQLGDDAAEALIDGLERDLNVLEQLMRRMRALSSIHDVDQMRSLDLVAVLRSIETGLRSHLRTRACDLRLEVPKEIFMAADRRRLEQALLGAALHAVERCGEGGNVLIRASVDGKRVDVEVHDDGMLPRPDELEAGREPFTPSREDRSGLQLWATRACVQRHRGSLRLERSELGGICRRLGLPRDLELGGDEAAPETRRRGSRAVEPV